MIDERVVEIAKNFCGYFTSILRPYPKYQLDFSWPSVGVLDLISQPLRFRTQRTDIEEELLRGISAYLAGMTYDTWVQFPNPPTVQVSLNDKGEITIEAKGGTHLPGRQSYFINLSVVLGEILSNPQNPLPVFEKTTRVISPQENWLSQFAIGLLSGLCPYGEGTWATFEDALFADYLVSCDSTLSQSAASYYKKAFPTEPLGASQTLYKQQLILPSISHKQRFPATTAANAVSKFLEKNSISDEEALRLSLHLAQSPDDLISSVGFIINAAFIDSSPSREILALSESFGVRVASLRPALLIARKALQKPDEWITLAQDGKFEQAMRLAHVESSLGFTPLLQLPLEFAQQHDFLPLLASLTWSDGATALECIEALSSSGIKSPHLTLQKAWILLFAQELELVEKTISELGEEIPVFSNEDFALLALIEATIETVKGQTNEVLSILTPHLSTFSFSLYAREIVPLYLESAITLGRFDKALQVIDVALKNFPLSPVILSKHIEISLKNGVAKESLLPEIEKLIRLAPMWTNTFQLLLNIVQD